MLLYPTGVPISRAVDPKHGDTAVHDVRATHLPAVPGRKALPVLGLLASFETYLEFRRRTGLTQRQTASTLQHIAAQLL